MTYFELLNTTDWRTRRDEILKRDGNVCQACSNMRYIQPTEFRIRIGIVDYSKDELMKKLCEIINHYNSWTTNILVSLAALGDKRHVEISVDSNILVPILNAHNEDSLIYITVDDNIPSKVNAIFSMNLVMRATKGLNGFEGYSTPFSALQKNGIVTWHYAKNLHVHHKYYRKELKPWEYPDDALQTLCWSCHEELHRNEKVPVLNAKQEKIGELTPCQRCMGAGYFPEYSHVQNGVCFGCNGGRFVELMR